MKTERAQEIMKFIENFKVENKKRVWRTEVRPEKNKITNNKK